MVHQKDTEKNSMTDYVIERAKSGDEEVLAYIQTESWKNAFKDILRKTTFTRE